MIDVQKHAPEVPIPIDRVGVRGVKVPLWARDRANLKQRTVASVDLSVDLPASFKGTHMSRFVEAIENWDGEISYKSVRGLLAVIRDRLEACRAQVCFHFPYFIRKNAPATGTPGEVAYNCMLTGELNEKDEQNFILDIEVPVMTVCPCSKAISDEGAHSQHARAHDASHELIRLDRGLCLRGGIFRIKSGVHDSEARGREIRHRACFCQSLLC